MSRSSRTFPKISFHGVKNRILREHQKADSQSAHRAEFLVGTTQFANPARMRKPRDCKSPGASPRAEFCLTQIACRLRLHGVGQYSAKVSRQILNSVVSFQNGCFGGSRCGHFCILPRDFSFHIPVSQKQNSTRAPSEFSDSGRFMAISLQS